MKTERPSQWLGRCSMTGQSPPTAFNARSYPWFGVIAVLLAVFFPCILRAQPTSGNCETIIAALKNAANRPANTGLDYPIVGKSTNWNCYQQQARQGDVMAEYIVGRTLLWGWASRQAGLVKIPQDAFKARMWLEKAAQHVDGPTGWPVAAESEDLLGYIYQYGMGTPIDLRKALAWYAKSLAHGNSSAQVAAYAVREQLSGSSAGGGSGFTASNGIGQAPSTTQSMQATMAKIDVNAMLQDAVQKKLGFTDDEIDRFAEKLDSYNSLNENQEFAHALIRACNDPAYAGGLDAQPPDDAAQACALLAEDSVNSLGANNDKVELAYQRACAIPRNAKMAAYVTGAGDSSEAGNFCAELGDLYMKRNDAARALAVYTSAPNCRANGFQPNNPQLFATACPLGAEKILKAQSEDTFKRCAGGGACSMAEFAEAKRSEQEVESRVHEICVRNPEVAETDKCLGYLNQQEQLAAERYDEQMSQKRQGQKREEDAQQAARDAAHDASVNALVSAIQSLPGASDPNGIVETANQQAANMVAVGTANDAARAQAAAERAAAQQREQIAEQQREEQTQIQSASVVTASPASQTGAVSGSASPTSIPTQAGASPSGATAPQTGGGSGTAASGQYVQAMATSCVRMFNDSSMYGWVALQNTCSQKMTVTFEGRNNGGVSGTMDLAPGQSYNTGRSPSEIDAVGGIYTYPCPYGYTPTTMAGQAVTAPVTQFTCKYRGY